MKKRLLFMIKSVIAGAVAMAVVSFGVNAAPTIPQGQGKVTFNGTVVDAPCSISQKSADQSIDFGQLSKSFLEAGGTSKPMDLDIELVNCDITAFKQGQALMNPLMIFIKIIKLRWIHILSYDQMVSRKINNQTTRCANSIFYTTLFTNSAPNYT
ncbi:type 1 fimbrial protein [Escherichia coli]|nr:type 1 fimbrial protein [Escherichia coli]EEW2234440.1 type 1 fimbrial protein [Escherichia coli]EEX2493078.1 type 1 fimbrial protein [Escherichia coli]EFA5530319.1 type 1 fimbrial protein [Escherichia coli]EFB2278912.1 type 1 fimbrial protein [Escherichia coli]